MPTTAREQITSTLAEYSGASRLLDLTIGEGRALRRDLLVEAFFATDAIQEVGSCDVIALSTSAFIHPQSLLGQAAKLELSLADGTRSPLSGEISEVAQLGSDGGLARYRIRVSCWLWSLGHVRNCRVWQDKRVIDIVDAVFSAYLPSARWRWSGEVNAFMAGTLPRSYCCQYRETDLDFVRRLLAEEGLGWRVEQDATGHGLVLFADSTQPSGVPADASNTSGADIRYHGASSVEQSDSVQALVSEQRLHASLTTLLSPNYKSKRSVSGNSPSFVRNDNLPELEIYDIPGQYAYANGDQARRYADLHMQGIEARGQQWQGRSTVRTLRAGTRLTISGVPLQRLAHRAAFTVLRVDSLGINNMPPSAQHALAELFGPVPELLQDMARRGSDELGMAIEQARLTGYANFFEAIPAEVPWRPQLAGSEGRTHAKPTAHGTQSAIVVGADGSDRPNGADELYCDRLGRVRIRFHWQDQGNASCWVRVAQRSAGSGMGCQFLPRIGQEVLVQFLENDIDRPVIVGALYNGQGEGGIAPTPGGRRDAHAGPSPFERANDQARSGQGNLAGGNSPVWHGASADSAGHRNGAAQWGIRSKEFGGSGYSQLLFDDTDAQGRVQLKCTHAASELNLGHLIHSVDNYRGSFRGLGAELRTDAYGAVRAGAGLLVSSFPIAHGTTARDPAGANDAGVGLLEQVLTMVGALHGATVAHETVGLAAHAGAMKAGTSVLDSDAPPLRAMHAVLAGSGDNPDLDQSGSETLPHMSDPLIAVASANGLGVDAGQSLQFANGETFSLVSGEDTQCISGAAMRLHAGQAIGTLGGAVNIEAGQPGLQLIAAQDVIDVQAQFDGVTVQARDEVDVVSANAHIDWVAAKSISVSVAGGANITIDGGNIVVQCPGKLVIHAGKKSLLGPEKMAYPMPALPRSICLECLKKSLAAGPAFTMVE
ncbi:type VI secretion system Vgr family protein [Massilia sp. HP4]|uniref:type VI secretion system Vgr family protein n=1 Tax=Massilia sp. HP4 TaxID=2562316 RepID=UPI0010C056DA|nr:type VI secretion system Vgr family protein [Massilia sp. HP4]